MTSLIITILVMIFVAYLILGICLYFMQPRLVFDPVRDLPYTPAELGLDYEDVFFRAGDRVRLHGWFVEAPVSPQGGPVSPNGSADSQFTVLFCHTNGGNMMFQLDTINVFYNLGISTFIFDYRGYGISQGKPTEHGTYLDARSAYRWLTKKKGVPPEKIIIMGRSLGGSLAAYLASKVKARGLVLESTFTSIPEIGRKFYPYMPVKWFVRYKYPTIDYIKKVSCPVMIIHSRNDEVIPFEFGQALFDAASEPKQFVEIFGGHNDGFLICADTYKKSWLKFISSLKEESGGHSAIIS